jgi:UBX domain-containing protein 6
LFTANYKNKEKLDKCIEIMNKFVDNILNNPKEEKYRKIRLENPIFKEKVYSCKYADMVLKKSGFKAKSISKFEPSPNEPDVQIEVNEDFFVFEEDNLQNLEKLKEALSLGEPITAQLYRDLKVYRINLNSTSANNFDLGEEFYNLNIEEMRREQQLRNETLEKQGMLRTKAMRERDEQLELRRYNYCLIRVRFPNDYILQVLIKS